jgi:hypothetical protein
MRYICVDGQHFQYFLCSVNCSYFIPNVTGRQAYWFSGNIRMRLSAGGAPVAVKRRVVEPANKVKILPVIYVLDMVLRVVYIL